MEKDYHFIFAFQNPVDCHICKAHELNALLQYMYVLICWGWGKVYSMVNDRTITG